MRVLLIKTSSMGDVIHTLPALSDAAHAHPDIMFDWMVEESFEEIPYWHANVERVIPIAFRRWRKGIFKPDSRKGFKHLRNILHEQKYDLILDAQGLVKSAFLSFFAKGMRAGLDFRSARESLAALAYRKKYKVNFYQHAIARMRNLFSQAFGYVMPNTKPNFSINLKRIKAPTTDENYIVFLHGTTWASKQWPENYWMELANIAAQSGLRIKISGGSDEEVARALRIAESNPAVDATPRLSISAMAKLLANAKGAVAVDTGFGHLAAALNIPTVSLYSSTNPEYTGALGDTSLHLNVDFACAPCLGRACTYKKPADVSPACFATLPPVKVWEVLNKIILPF